MMPVSHVQSRVCYVTVLVAAPDARSYLRSASSCASNRMLTAGDLTATGVIVNKHFLILT